MSFIESPRLDKCYAFGSTGGPGFNNEIVEVASGYEQVNRLWSQARRRYNVSYNAKRPEVFETLIKQYLEVGGTEGRFRMRDPNDYFARQGEGIVQLVTTNVYQMYKTYAWGSNPHNRKIQKPYGTITVIGGTSPVVNTVTGRITTSGGTVTGWYGDFDVPVRFVTEMMQATVINKSVARGLITSWESVELIEVRLDDDGQ